MNLVAIVTIIGTIFCVSLIIFVFVKVRKEKYKILALLGQGITDKTTDELQDMIWIGDSSGKLKHKYFGPRYDRYHRRFHFLNQKNTLHNPNN